MYSCWIALSCIPGQNRMLPECYIFRSNSDPGPFTKDAHSGNYLSILYFYKKAFFSTNRLNQTWYICERTNISTVYIWNVGLFITLISASGVVRNVTHCQNNRVCFIFKPGKTWPAILTKVLSVTPRLGGHGPPAGQKASSSVSESCPCGQTPTSWKS